MKKTTTLLFVAFAILATIVNAQNNAAQGRSVFRKGYLRIGLSTLGNSLNNSSSPKTNILAGNYGAGTGFALDLGHVFYFHGRSNNSKINFGLDWTIFSASYSKLDKWNDYATANGVTGSATTGTSIAIASKLGPVISVNPFEKFVLDARFQIGYQARASSLDYSDHNGTARRGFIFGNPDNETISTRLASGLCTSFGFTIRRKAIGFSLDYISSKPNTTFTAKDAGISEATAKQEITTNDLQLKVSFTF